MIDFDRYTPLLQDGGRILLLVVDGLGGYPEADRGSELEDAHTPNLDALAASGITGLTEPAGPGITVGSGPGHLALFGYDPWRYDLGRGVLAAVGTGFPLQPGDVAARGNLAFLDADGLVEDRRAGRISDHRAEPLTQRVQERLDADPPVDGVEVFLRHVSEHRVLLVLRGEGLDARLADMDPQDTGLAPLSARALGSADGSTAAVVDAVDAAVRAALAAEEGDERMPDVALFRGFDGLREMPDFGERTGLRAAAIASYPMYRGVAQLVGMEILHGPDGPPTSMAQQIELARGARRTHDFLFVHYKYADAAGHDGNREAKVEALEQLDVDLPALLEAADADVVAVSGDHASPAAASGHSWHPVPTLVAGGSAGVDDVATFGERACAGGLLGLRPTQHLLPIALGAAGRLAKYGA
ncbi:phosphoglycerate mutase [Euzebya rosea]|uniref:phosphoglycerate mutase n=1 Tax=Euzebya rosea TaxID=2052804 RepID=UPI000D3E811E|nr:phosphoglycerate mutase [Euzebya rosea]